MDSDRMDRSWNWKWLWRMKGHIADSSPERGYSIDQEQC